MRSLCMGRRPNTRHDGKEWQASDKARVAQANTKFGLWANIAHVGGWMHYKRIFVVNDGHAIPNGALHGKQQVKNVS